MSVITAQVAAEMIEKLDAEIARLRAQLAERDEQLAVLREKVQQYADDASDLRKQNAALTERAERAEAYLQAVRDFDMADVAGFDPSLRTAVAVVEIKQIAKSYFKPATSEQGKE